MARIIPALAIAVPMGAALIAFWSALGTGGIVSSPLAFVVFLGALLVFSVIFPRRAN